MEEDPLLSLGEVSVPIVVLEDRGGVGRLERKRNPCRAHRSEERLVRRRELGHGDDRQPETTERHRDVEGRAPGHDPIGPPRHADDVLRHVSDDDGLHGGRM